MSMKSYVFKDVRGEVYTAGARSARGFTFLDDGEEGMPVERRKDAGSTDVGLLEERGQGGPIKSVEQSMPDGLSESPEVMENDVSLRTKFILIRSLQMSAIEY